LKNERPGCTAAKKEAYDAAHVILSSHAAEIIELPLISPARRTPDILLIPNQWGLLGIKEAGGS
jgi:hypothetical protein